MLDDKRNVSGEGDLLSADMRLNIAEQDQEEVNLSDLRWSDGLVLLLFWALGLTIFLQFFTRYVLNNSLGWTEEIARYMLIGVTFAGAVMAARKNSHIAVEFLYRWMPRPLRRLMQGVIDLGTAGLFGVLSYLTGQLAGKTRQMMVSIDIPKAYVYWFVSACFAAMAFWALANGWKHLRNGTSRLIDPDSAHPDDVRLID